MTAEVYAGPLGSEEPRFDSGSEPGRVRSRLRVSICSIPEWIPIDPSGLGGQLNFAAHRSFVPTRHLSPSLF